MIQIVVSIGFALLAWLAVPAAIDTVLRRRAVERLKRREHPSRELLQAESALEATDPAPRAPSPLPALHEISSVRRLLLVFPPYSALGCVARGFFYNSLLAIPFVAFGREPSAGSLDASFHPLLAILPALVVVLFFRWLALIVVRRDRRWHASYLEAWARAA